MFEASIGGIKTSATFDSGADRTIIPRTLMEELKKKGSKEELIKIADEHGSMGEGKVKSKAMLSMIISSLAGQVRLPLITCWVVEKAMEYVLIGLPELDIS